MDAAELASDVALAQSGDAGALDRCLQAVQLPLFRFIRSLVGERREAEDVTQDALLTVCRKIRWLDDPHAFRAWSFQIAWRIALRSLSRAQKRRIESEELPPAVPAPEVENIDPWLKERLRGTVMRLSPGNRAVVELHYGAELSLQEVAAVLEVPAGTVKSRLAAALTQLRRELAEEMSNDVA